MYRLDFISPKNVREKESTVDSNGAVDVLARLEQRDLVLIAGISPHWSVDYITAHLDGKMVRQAMVGFAFPETKNAPKEAYPLTETLEVFHRLLPWR